MMDRKAEPEIRFKGFTDSWEQRKLGDCFSSLQNNTLSRADLNDENGAAMNVHYGDVLIKFNECLDISKEHLPYIEEKDIVDKFKTSYLQNGDIVIADTAEDETVGKCTEIIGLSDQKVISGLHTIPLRPNIKFASGYLGFYLNSDSYHEQLKPLMQGIKVTSISKNAMQDTTIRYPDNTREQGLIGQYFLNLDRLITLYQRKCDKLCDFKKALLCNMFPAAEADAPKVRFKGYTKPWKHWTLGELYTERKEAGNDDLPILSVSIHSGVSADELDSAELGKAVRRSEDKSLYKHTYKGDLVFNMMRAWQGAIGVVPKEGMVSPAYITAIPNDEVFPEFMDYCLRREEVINQINNLSYGVTDFRKRLYWDSFVRVQIMLPSVEEQKKIAETLVQLDKLIELQSAKVEKLKNLKAACLEKMFV